MPPAGAQPNRNDPCPCGSGRKYKKCCMGKPGAVRAPAQPAAPDPRELMRQATARHGAGQLGAAAALYRQVIERRPREAAALFNLGMIVQQQGDVDEGVALIRRAIEVDGRRAEFHAALADVLYTARRTDESHASADRAIALDRNNAWAYSVKALLHERQHEIEDAVREIERATSLAPDNAPYGLILARIRRRQGDLPAARAELERVITLASNPEVAHRAWGELGGVLKRLGEHDAAFDAFARSNAAQADTAEARRIDREAWPRLIAAYDRGVTAERVAEWSARADAADDAPAAPIMLVGFPRSGTTMTEQILASHPSVVATDEAPLVRSVRTLLAEMTGGTDDVPAMLATLDDVGMRRLRDQYWNEAARHVTLEPGQMLLDKYPLNIVELGLINALFPGARTIVVLRDPRDVCLSCFEQRFELNEAMANFLEWERTAAFYAEVMTLWRRQRDILGLRLVEVRYEDIVADFAGEARRLTTALELPWDDAILRFHERARERVISTPSYEAVTSPVNARAAGRWRRHPAPIARVAAPLAPFVEAFGYEATDEA